MIILANREFGVTEDMPVQLQVKNWGGGGITKILKFGNVFFYSGTKKKKFLLPV